MAPRVAILGASGFGRFHAKWYAALGCQVVAFLGSSPRSVQRTAAALQDEFGLEPRGYTDLDELLSTESPDAASVCTPPPLHAHHTLEALQAGCSVLCEKPFVWDPASSREEMLAAARKAVEVARARGLVLAVNMQYAAAADLYRQLVPPEVLREPQRFTAEMTSLLKPKSPSGAGILADLLPHPLSELLALLPEAELVEGSVDVGVGRRGSEVAFEVRLGERRCEVDVRVAKLPAEPFPRRFGLDSLVADCQSAPDRDGLYRGRLRLGEREVLCDDFMKISLERFVKAVRGQGEPLVDTAAAVKNLAMMLAVLEAAGATR